MKLAILLFRFITIMALAGFSCYFAWKGKYDLATWLMVVNIWFSMNDKSNDNE